MIGFGELASILGGSSGFNNANLRSIPITITTPALFSSGDALFVKLLARNACVGSGKNSGHARLWYGDSAANSGIEPILTNSLSYFLTGTSTLQAAVGTTRQSIDVSAGAKCRAHKRFGTWRVIF